MADLTNLLKSVKPPRGIGGKKGKARKLDTPGEDGAPAAKVSRVVVEESSLSSSGVPATGTVGMDFRSTTPRVASGSAAGNAGSLQLPIEVESRESESKEPAKPSDDTPIRLLSPETRQWSLTGRACDKTALMPYSKVTEGVWFSVTLVDSAGDRIKAVAWNNQARLFHSVFEEGKIYLLRNCSIATPKVQRPVGYELHLTDASVVLPQADRPGYLVITPALQAIAEVLSVPIGSVVTITGVVAFAYPLTSSPNKKIPGGSLARLRIKVAQPSVSIAVTLFGNAAILINNHLKEDKHPVCRINGIVGMYQDQLSLSLGDPADVKFPDVSSPEASPLLQWWRGLPKNPDLPDVNTIATV